MRKAGWAAAILVVWLGGVAAWIAASPAPDDGHAGTAIVLGAAVDGDVPSPVFAARIDHAIRLYREGRVRRILFTGGQSPEDSISEGDAAAAYAQARGVPAEAVLIERTSKTTRANIRHAARVLGPSRDRVLIVTDPLHMRRALAMAGNQGLNAGASPTPSTRYRSLRTQLPFLLREVFFMHVYWVTGK